MCEQRWEMVAREYLPGGWRHSTYRRPDGSVFFVDLPPSSITGTVGYDEDEERRMAAEVGVS